jgi:hypothetical protein
MNEGKLQNPYQNHPLNTGAPSGAVISSKSNPSRANAKFNTLENTHVQLIQNGHPNMASGVGGAP